MATILSNGHIVILYRVQRCLLLRTHTYIQTEKKTKNIDDAGVPSDEQDNKDNEENDTAAGEQRDDDREYSFSN